MTPAPTPLAVKPREEKRRARAAPLYRRWYFWSGVLLAGAAAAYATSNELGKDPGGGGSDDPDPDPGVTIEFEAR